MGEPPTPIFIFSLPRAGSTLLQRMLAAHDAIASAPEPTFLLPLLYTLKDRDVYAAYSHELAVWAIEDFAATLPNGRADYLAELREMALRLYGKSAENDEPYFVDKTPIYSLIVDDIVELFPDARFIFLWRNPLAAVASIMRSFSNGKWFVYQFDIHFYRGLFNLIDASQRYADRSCTVRYEDLIDQPDATLQSIFTYLDLPFDATILERFVDVQFEGRFGDPNAAKSTYRTLRRDSLDRWPRDLASPLRRRWCHRYLQTIGAKRLAVMGYDLDQISAELNATPRTFRHVPSDAWRMTYGWLYRTIELRQIKHKLQAVRRGERLYLHQ